MKKTVEVNVSRLRSECASLGLELDGSRNELVNRLHQAGVYDINTDTVYPPVMKNTYDPSSVLIGSVAQDGPDKNSLVVSNNKNVILSGNFAQKNVRIHDCLNVVETRNLTCDTPGTEGDIRRHGGSLYMYRTTGVEPGWYAIAFGRALIF
jgi:hypothetical protein